MPSMKVEMIGYRLETQTPSLPKSSDWKEVGKITIIAATFESAASLAFSKMPETDQVFVTSHYDKETESPIYFYRSYPSSEHPMA